MVKSPPSAKSLGYLMFDHEGNQGGEFHNFTIRLQFNNVVVRFVVVVYPQFWNAEICFFPCFKNFLLYLEEESV